jgi:ABC-type multidrug transport system fused ATPase/permease subunit
MPKPDKVKVSRKDLAKLSTAETFSLARQTYAKLFGYIRPYRLRFALGILFGILSGLSNMLLLQGLKLVIQVVLPIGDQALEPTGNTGLGIGRWSINPLDYVPESWRGSEKSVICACLILPGVFVLRGTLTYLANYFMMWVSNRVLHDLRNDCYRALLGQSVRYFAEAKVGNLVQTVFNQARVAQQNLMMLAKDIVERPVAIISVLIFCFSENAMFTLYSLIVLPLSILPVIAIGRKVRKAGAQEEQEAGQMMVQMTECFQGIRVVKSHAREAHEAKKFESSSSKMNKLIMRYGKAMELVGASVEVVASLGVCVGLFYAWKHGINQNTFFMLVGGLTQIYPHTKALSRLQLVMQKAIVATSTIFAAMQQKPEVEDKPDAIALKDATGHITFDNVTFSYKTNDQQHQQAITDISIDFEPGKFYALVGRSGAGKSTLFALIQRFYDADVGTVTVGDHDVRRVTQTSLREHIGVVSQDTFLFHDTILENIRYGRLDATKEEIIAASMKAHAHEFISADQQGYEKLVGDGGVTLSGGQKQRVSIARAILRNAPILLLDEATSALDPETERNIKDAVHTLTEGKTVIAIAHRLSTVMEADQIIVMEQGRIVDKGRHEELLSRCELYQTLCTLSFQEA